MSVLVLALHAVCHVLVCRPEKLRANFRYTCPDARTLFARIAFSIADHVLILLLLPLSSHASMQLLLLVA